MDSDGIFLSGECPVCVEKNKEIENLKRMIEGMAQRIVSQSELLTKKAEKVSD